MFFIIVEFQLLNIEIENQHLAKTTVIITPKKINEQIYDKK